MVRCKFKCTSKEDNNDGSKIIMQPVYCGSEENEQFFAYTPYGMFEMGTVNPNAAHYFTEGKEYYIDITEA